MANYEALTIGELLNTNNSELLNSVLFQLQVCHSQKHQSVWLIQSELYN